MDSSEKILIKHCAQVYLTTNDSLLFHCVLCDSQKLTNIRGLSRHLRDEHMHVLLELKAKQNSEVEKDNEINMQEFENSINNQFEDSMDNAEIKSSEHENIIEEHEEETIDNAFVEFDMQPIVTNELNEFQMNEESSQVYEEDLDNIVEFIEENEENKISNKNTEKDNNNSETVDSNSLPIRKELNAYYASRTNGEGEYPCPVCDRSFLKKDVLARHLVRHREPQIECDHCTKKFYTRTELSHHKRRVNGVKPYMCTHCGQQYSTSGALTQHMKRHLNIRNVECEICGKRFFDRGHLKHHIVVHTRERAFSCPICDVKLARRKSLLTHLKIHANKREYVCKVCGAAFNQLPGLHVHMRSKHKDIVQPPKDESTT